MDRFGGDDDGGGVGEVECVVGAGVGGGGRSGSVLQKTWSIAIPLSAMLRYCF